MKLFYYMILWLGLNWTIPSQTYMPKQHSKKLSKMFKKYYKGLVIEIEEVSLVGDSKVRRLRAFYKLNHEQNLVGILSINRTNGCRVGGCSAGNYIGDAKYENFWYAIIFDLDLKIKGVKVLEYQSEYGYEISGKNWLKQFRGHNGCDLEYGTKQIDAISGATVSGQSIVADVNSLCWLLPEVYADHFLEADKSP